jgi:hypothetical protein
MTAARKRDQGSIYVEAIRLSRTLELNAIEVRTNHLIRVAIRECRVVVHVYRLAAVSGIWFERENKLLVGRNQDVTSGGSASRASTLGFVVILISSFIAWADFAGKGGAVGAVTLRGALAVSLTNAEGAVWRYIWMQARLS